MAKQLNSLYYDHHYRSRFVRTRNHNRHRRNIKLHAFSKLLIRVVQFRHFCLKLLKIQEQLKGRLLLVQNHPLQYHHQLLSHVANRQLLPQLTQLLPPILLATLLSLNRMPKRRMEMKCFGEYAR